LDSTVAHAVTSEIIWFPRQGHQAATAKDLEGMKINVIGQHHPTGFGNHFSAFCEHLKKYSYLEGEIFEYRLTDEASVERLVKSATPRDINIWFYAFARPGTLMTRGRNVVWAIFEQDKLAPAYLNKLSRADLIWTPSSWAKAILERQGLPTDKVDLVPEGVDPGIFHPFCRAWHEARSRDTFRFLMVGKFEARKGYTQLVEAFVKAFGKDPKVELLIKGDFFHQGREVRGAKLLDLVRRADAPNIRLLTGEVSREELFMIYNAADAFVFPSRAEGWGLPLIEAMACGLPAIAVNYSGQTEFLKEVEGHFMPVAHRLVPINDPEYQQFALGHEGDWGRWAEADVDDLAQKLQEMVKNYPAWRQNGLRASQILRAKFPWTTATDIALESLIRQGLLPPAGFQLPPNIAIR
jgi:glycosyltransferase involved in cell wall biosynthesis